MLKLLKLIKKTIKMKDNKKKSLWKTASYRISSSFLTVLIVFIITKKINISLGVGAIDVIAKSIWYYSHERLWEHLKLKKKAIKFKK